MLFNSSLNKTFQQIHRIGASWRTLNALTKKDYFPMCEPNSYFVDPQMPLLDRNTLSSQPPNSLVRCRLMIQDCFDPEYFGGILEEYSENSDEKRIRHSKYQDFIPIEEGKRWRDIETMERTVYYCVPIPAETSWSKRFVC